MRYLLLSLILSGLLLAAGPLPAAAAASRLAPPGKFGRWINRRTRPIGRVVEKVTPFRLVKYTGPKVGGCCFPADTRISLPGGATCAIGELQVGQVVLGWNPATGRLDTARVAALATVVHDSLRRLAFADGRTITATADHPFWVPRTGWASLAPDLATARYAVGTTHLLRPGDACLVFNGGAPLTPARLRTVTNLTACNVLTYTITRLSRGCVFFANGLAVGVEGDRRSPPRPSEPRLAQLPQQTTRHLIH